MMSYGDPTVQSWALVEDHAEPIVRCAVEAGITFFDTADTYSDGASEVLTGRLLANLFKRREDYALATKVFYPTGPGPNDRGLSRKHIMVRNGMVRYVGASAMYAWQFAKLQHCAVVNSHFRFVTMQNRYNLVNREDERGLIPMRVTFRGC
jgi:aryl-alcohol dehydrogenase-like predicted oxidoreductase